MNENQLQQNAQLISQLLQQSVAQDQTIRRNAEKHLLQFQKLPGFCFILTVILENVNVSEQVRQAAALLLKNTVRELWRSVQENEQHQVRERVLQLCLREENAKVWPTLHAVLAWSIWWDIPSDLLDQQLTDANQSQQHTSSSTLTMTTTTTTTTTTTSTAATSFTSRGDIVVSSGGSGGNGSVSLTNPLHILAEHAQQSSSDMSWLKRSGLQALLDAIQQTSMMIGPQNPQAYLAAVRGLQVLRETLLYLIPCRLGDDIAPNYPLSSLSSSSSSSSSHNNEANRPVHSPVDMDPDENEWLIGKRRRLRTASLSIFAQIVPLWGSSMQTLISVLSNFKDGKHSGEALSSDVQYRLLTQYVLAATRILRALLLAYVPYFVRHNTQGCYNVLSGFLNSLRTLSSFCKTFQHQQPLLTRHIWKIVVLLSRTLSDLQCIHPLTCAPLLNEIITFCKTELTENASLLITEEEINHHEKYVVQLMGLLSRILTTPEYTDSISEIRQWRRSRGLAVDMREEVDEQLVSQVHQTLTNALSSTALFELIKLLLTHYMRLTPRELHLWETDPESYIDEMLGEFYQQRVGPSAEYLYIVSLRASSSQSLARQIVDLVQNTLIQISQQQQLTQEMILLKDSCYWALAAGYNSLCEVLDFEKLFREFLVHELQVTHPAYKIIRRRVAHVLESWVMAIVEKPYIQNAVFQICVPLLGDADLVVRFYAVVALRNLIGDFELTQSGTLTLIDPMIRGIVALVNDMHSSTSCVQVLHMLSVIIVNLGPQVRPFVETIMKCMSTLWRTSHEVLIQAAILRTLASLVEAMDSSDVTSLYPDLQAVLNLSIDVQSPAFISLHDEGLHLWFSLLQQLPAAPSTDNTITQSLLELFSKLLSIIDFTPKREQQATNSTTTPSLLLLSTTKSSSSTKQTTQQSLEGGYRIQEVMHILHAYLLWGGSSFVEQHLSIIIHLFKTAVENSTRAPKLESVLATLSTFLQMFPTQAPPVLLPTLKLLVHLLFRYFKEKDVACVIITLLTRVLLHSRDVFLQLFQDFSSNASFATTSSPSSSSLFSQYIQLWLLKAPSLHYVDQLRIAVLGLSMLLVSEDASFVSIYGVSIVETCAKCLEELNTKLKTSSTSSRHLSYKQELNKFISHSPAARNKEQLIAQDPLLNTHPVQYFLAKLDESFKIHGAAWQDHLKQQLTPKTMQFIQKSIKQNKRSYNLFRKLNLFTSSSSSSNRICSGIYNSFSATARAFLHSLENGESTNKNSDFVTSAENEIRRALDEGNVTPQHIVRLLTAYEKARYSAKCTEAWVSWLKPLFDPNSSSLLLGQIDQLIENAHDNAVKDELEPKNEQDQSTKALSLWKQQLKEAVVNGQLRAEDFTMGDLVAIIDTLKTLKLFDDILLVYRTALEPRLQRGQHDEADWAALTPNFIADLFYIFNVQLDMCEFPTTPSRINQYQEELECSVKAVENLWQWCLDHSTKTLLLFNEEQQVLTGQTVARTLYHRNDVITSVERWIDKLKAFPTLGQVLLEDIIVVVSREQNRQRNEALLHLLHRLHPLNTRYLEKFWISMADVNLHYLIILSIKLLLQHIETNSVSSEMSSTPSSTHSVSPLTDLSILSIALNACYKEKQLDLGLRLWELLRQSILQGSDSQSNYSSKENYIFLLQQAVVGAVQLSLLMNQEPLPGTSPPTSQALLLVDSIFTTVADTLAKESFDLSLQFYAIRMYHYVTLGRVDDALQLFSQLRSTVASMNSSSPSSSSSLPESSSRPTDTTSPSTSTTITTTSTTSQSNVESPSDSVPISDNININANDVEVDNIEDVGEDVDENVEENVGEDVDENIEENVGEDVDENIEENVGEDVDENVEENVGEDVDENIEENVGEDVDKDAGENVEEDVEEEYLNKEGMNLISFTQLLLYCVIRYHPQWEAITDTILQDLHSVFGLSVSNTYLDPLCFLLLQWYRNATASSQPEIRKRILRAMHLLRQHLQILPQDSNHILSLMEFAAEEGDFTLALELFGWLKLFPQQLVILPDSPWIQQMRTTLAILRHNAVGQFFKPIMKNYSSCLNLTGYQPPPIQPRIDYTTLYTLLMRTYLVAGQYERVEQIALIMKTEEIPVIDEIIADFFARINPSEKPAVKTALKVFLILFNANKKENLFVWAYKRQAIELALSSVARGWAKRVGTTIPIQDVSGNDTVVRLFPHLFPPVLIGEDTLVGEGVRTFSPKELKDEKLVDYLVDLGEDPHDLQKFMKTYNIQTYEDYLRQCYLGFTNPSAILKKDSKRDHRSSINVDDDKLNEMLIDKDIYENEGEGTLFINEDENRGDGPELILEEDENRNLEDGEYEDKNITNERIPSLKFLQKADEIFEDILEGPLNPRGLANLTPIDNYNDPSISLLLQAEPFFSSDFNPDFDWHHDRLPPPPDKDEPQYDEPQYDEPQYDDEENYKSDLMNNYSYKRAPDEDELEYDDEEEYDDEYIPDMPLRTTTTTTTATSSQQHDKQVSASNSKLVDKVHRHSQSSLDEENFSTLKKRDLKKAEKKNDFSSLKARVFLPIPGPSFRLRRSSNIVLTLLVKAEERPEQVFRLFSLLRENGITIHRSTLELMIHTIKKNPTYANFIRSSSFLSLLQRLLESAEIIEP